ncbi:DUF1206 domain-containing protein [Halobacillus yeomjeoni]|uniref:DUF1206 domain-containing protein n=2 Tax=Halobacillus yeomjeoni TaxID=311194 RepID=A0A931MWF9_9BACI|nr:DUF1206 domain-containing protein [Halobacillus yeomjeoni]MBH0231286.1 DUF1206 domain-containing protein [Halobacillus yeomjeoni]MCA0984199.1 DUF1206 domain-containing protein [Halobacillus yeomjeoni]
MTRTKSTTKEDIKPWIRRFARFGYMAKGFVYVVIGILAFMAAIGVGGKTTDTKGMLRSLATLPFGAVLLWLTAAGLICYILWVFLKAVKDPKDKGSDAKGLANRAMYILSGIIYSGIALNAVQIAMNAGSSGGGNTQETLSAKLLSQPFGQWILGAVGLAIIGYGLNELYGGVTTNFMGKFHTGMMDDHEKKLARNSGRLGLVSRGIVLSLIGYFFIQTAITANPEKAKGLDEALSELAQKPFGQWILGIVSLGLLLYGTYQIIRGRHENMSFGKVK